MGEIGDKTAGRPLLDRLIRENPNNDNIHFLIETLSKLGEVGAVLPIANIAKANKLAAESSIQALVHILESGATEVPSDELRDLSKLEDVFQSRETRDDEWREERIDTSRVRQLAYQELARRVHA